MSQRKPGDKIFRPQRLKPKREPKSTVGMVAFFGGMILATLAGIFWRDVAGISLALVLLGIGVGVLYISDREILPFLISSIALVLIGSGSFTVLNGLVNGFGSILNEIVAHIATFMVPAAIISAVRMIWRIGQPGKREFFAGKS